MPDARIITTTSVDVEGEVAPTTITARLVTLEGLPPPEGVTVQGETLSSLPTSFVADVNGQIVLKLVPPTLMTPTGLGWSLSWPGSQQPLIINFGPGPDATLSEILAENPYEQAVDELLESGDLLHTEPGSRFEHNGGVSTNWISTGIDFAGLPGESIIAQIRATSGPVDLGLTIIRKDEISALTPGTPGTSSASSGTYIPLGPEGARVGRLGRTAANILLWSFITSSTVEKMVGTFWGSRQVTGFVTDFVESESDVIVSRATVYPPAKAILRGSDSILVKADDDTDTLTLSAVAGADLPAGYAAGLILQRNATDTGWDWVNLPKLSDTAPGNTPGTPSAGSSKEVSRADHDHGATGSQFTPSKTNLYSSVKGILDTAANTVVTVSADDSNSELDLGIGAGKVTKAMLAGGVLPTVPSKGTATPKVESGSGAAGSAATWAPIDHVHPARSLSIPAKGTATPKVESGSGTVGSSAKWSPEDHVHPARTLNIPAKGTATPKVESGSGAAGTGSKWSPEDHVHPARTITQFTPSQANLYSSVKSILSTTANTIVTFTGDDTNHELDATIGAGKVTQAMLASAQQLPASLGSKGQILAVNEAATDTEWVAAPSAGTGLPSGWTASKMLQRNSADDGWDWIDKPSFTPSQSNLYSSVKSILGTSANTVVTFTGDDDNNELDVTIGAGKVTKAMIASGVIPSVPAKGTATPKVESGSGSAGTGATWAPIDHVHPARSLNIPVKGTATPKVESGTGSAGTGSKWSPEDHVHPARSLPTPPPTVAANPSAAGTQELVKLGITPSGGSQTVYTLPSGVGQSNIGLTEIFAEDITSAGTANRYVAVGTENISSLTDWFYLRLSRAGWDDRYILLRLSELSAKNSSAAGSAATNGNSIVLNDVNANKDAHLGKASDGTLLFATDDTSIAVNVAAYKGTQVVGQFVPSQANIYPSVKAIMTQIRSADISVAPQDASHGIGLTLRAASVGRDNLESDQQMPASLGTAGQVLTVNSGADGTEWAAASGGGDDTYQRDLDEQLDYVIDRQLDIFDISAKPTTTGGTTATVDSPVFLIGLHADSRETDYANITWKQGSADTSGSEYVFVSIDTDLPLEYYGVKWTSFFYSLTSSTWAEHPLTNTPSGHKVYQFNSIQGSGRTYTTERWTKLPVLGEDIIGLGQLSATGTASATTFLRGDNSWATPSGGGGSFTPTKANLYSSVKAILSHSGQTVVTVSGDDTNNELDLSIGAEKVTHNMLAANSVTTTKILDNQVTGAKLIPLQTLPTPAAGDGGKAVTLKSDRSGFELTTVSGGGTAPTQANIYPIMKDILEMGNRMTGTDDDSAETITINSIDDIIETDWADLTVGYGFRVGNVVKRNSLWFVCEVKHEKETVGPDNDPTRWAPLTTYGGSYSDTAWYHAGTTVLYDSGIAIATADIAPSDPVPDAADNTKWVIPGRASGASVDTRTLIHEVEFTGPVSGWQKVDFTIPEVAAGELYEVIGVMSAQLKPGRTDTVGVSLSGNYRQHSSSSQNIYPDNQLRHYGGQGTLNLAGPIDITNRPAASITRVNAFTNEGPAGDIDWSVYYTLTSFLQDVTDGSLKIYVQRAGGYAPTQNDIYPAVKPMLKAGDNVTVTADDIHQTLTVASDEETADTLYPIVKTMPKAGNNVKITFDDTEKHWVTDVRLPDEAAPRVYALDSRDVRTVAPPYSYNIITEGFTLVPGQKHGEPGPVSYHGYNSGKPGFARDTTNSRNNSNGVDFSNATAGTTTRVIHISSEVTVANERQYSSAETLTMRVYTAGYLKPHQGQADGQLTFTKVFHFSGGNYQDAFNYDFDLTYSAAPRIGEHDWWWCDYQWATGSGEVVAGVIQSVKHTASLPALGSIPKQSFTHRGTQDLDEIQDWIPPELVPQMSSISRVATFNVGSPDNTGTNAPNESDKSDALLPTIDSTTPFLRASQDLSRLKLHFAGQAQSGGGDIYLCSRIQGFPPSVLANVPVTSAWTIDFTAQGVMSLQDYYLLDPTGAGMGAPTATWDANPGGPKINNVIDGIFHTAHLTAGINFTPVVTNEISIDDDGLTNAAEAGLLHVMRLISGNAVAEIPLRGVPRPVPFGSGSSKRRVIGSGRVKIDAGGTGGNNTLVWVDCYRDIHGLHFSIRGSSGAAQPCYISGAEIEYAVYKT